MVENLQSNTKTVNAISFKNSERFYASDAASKISKNPKFTFNNLNKFIGFDLLNFDNNNNNKNEENKNNRLEYLYENLILNDIIINKDTNSLLFKFDKNLFLFENENDQNDENSPKKNTLIPIEEIYAMIFRYIKSFSDKFLQRDITNFAIAMPSFFSYKKRISIYQALQIANIKPYCFISSGISAGLSFALEKSFIENNKTNKNLYTIIYDMGSAFTQGTLFSFNAQMKLQNKKNIEIVNMRKVYETWNEDLGGNNFDLIIAEILLEKYLFTNEKAKLGLEALAKNKINNINKKDNFKREINNLNYTNFFDFSDFSDVQENLITAEKLKILNKLILPAKKIKEILSANKEHKFLIIIDNENFSGVITRQEFEIKAENLLKKVTLPIDKILEATNKDISEIESIQIIGGGLRINKIQKILQEKFNKNSEKKILVNLNSDDSIAMGASYFVANKTISNFVYKDKLVLFNNKYLFNSDYKIRVRNLIENFDNENEVNNVNENNLIFCSEIDKDNDKDNNSENCLEKVDEERTIFSKDLIKDNKKTLNFKNKINTDLIIEIHEYFKQYKNTNNDNNNIKNTKSSINQIGTYRLKNVKNYLNIIKSEILEENYSNKNQKNFPHSMNLIFSIDQFGAFNLIAEFEYELNFYLNFEKTKRGEFRFFYSTNIPEKIDNKTLTEEFNYINTDKNFKAFSKNDKIFLKKKLKYDIGKLKKEIRKKEIQLEFSNTDNPLPLTKKDILKARVRLNRIDEKDEKKRKLGEKMNSLENLLYEKIEFLKAKENLKYFSEGENNRLYSTLNSMKEELFESGSEINPFYKKGNFVNFGNKKNEGNERELFGVEENVNYVNSLFKNIDKFVEIEKNRVNAIEEFNGKIISVNKEFEKLKKFLNEDDDRNFVDLNGYGKAYRKDMVKLSKYFKNNVYEKAIRYDEDITVKINEQNEISVKESPKLTKKYLQKYIVDISSMLEKHFSDKGNIERKYKKIQNSNNKKNNKKK